MKDFPISYTFQTFFLTQIRILYSVVDIIVKSDTPQPIGHDQKVMSNLLQDLLPANYMYEHVYL